MKIPELKIGGLTPRLPLVQGGMGVGVSMWRLASAVANNGGIGVISGVEPGFALPDYRRNKKEANRKALAYNIKKARQASPTGIIGVNIMTALNDFEEMVQTAVRERIDIIFSGAGLPLKLPGLVRDSITRIAPIVSSARAAAVLCKHWDRKFSYLPDAIVVEGPRAGGHLGFTLEQLKNMAEYPLTRLVEEVLLAVEPFEEKYRKNIPLIAGGGVYDGNDAARVFSAGAMGIQMATRFVATFECDVHQRFKDQYINAGKDDVVIIKSPVGLPGRAIRNAYLKDVESGIKKPFKCLSNCLKTCNPSLSPYCIADALINAQQGNLQNGFAFAGDNVYRVNKMSSVKDIINEVMDEIRKA
ncbi:MAG: nitronate monooxygenase family protein [Firmicutes bacterium]|nr:nitronate monooxygenase family protein [Bacillota bacterium]